MKYIFALLSHFYHSLIIYTKQIYKINYKPILYISLVCFIALVVWSCLARGIGPVGPDGVQLTWSKMNIEQRKAHMRNVIVPRAGAIFQEWRPDRYATIDCSLCHGDAENTGNFHMPTNHLPRLSGEVLLGPERTKYPETTELKLNRLVPVIADALGVSSFSIVTRRGFGCYSCHLGPSGPMFGH
jgi:hypothetical protein